jgi:nucleoside 2-deoxyribosyltransferase
MDVVFTLEEMPGKINKSIFLAGPTNREGGADSWRKVALQFLEEKGFDGHVFVPEARGWVKFNPEYDTQILWEEKFLAAATCILFWIPRDLKILPGFTTNDEWGFWKASGKVVLGAPTDAPKTSYQKFYALRLNVPFSHSLSETVQNAINKAEELK